MPVRCVEIICNSTVALATPRKGQARTQFQFSLFESLCHYVTYQPVNFVISGIECAKENQTSKKFWKNLILLKTQFFSKKFLQYVICSFSQHNKKCLNHEHFRLTVWVFNPLTTVVVVFFPNGTMHIFFPGPIQLSVKVARAYLYTRQLICFLIAFFGRNGLTDFHDFQYP